MTIQKLLHALLSLQILRARHTQLFSPFVLQLVLTAHPEVIAHNRAERKHEEPQKSSVSAQESRRVPVNLCADDAQALARDLRHCPRRAALGVAGMVDGDPGDGEDYGGEDS